MQIYSIDVMVCATAYIRAASAEDAKRIAVGLKLQSPCIPGGRDGCDGEIEISGRRYDDPELPDVSLSPAMTIHGPMDGAVAGLADE